MIWICKFCKKELELKNKYTKSGHLAKCSEWHKFKEEILSYENLYKWYIQENLSTTDIKEKLDLDSESPIWKRLKMFKINIRSLKETASSHKTQSKTRRTHLERYGIEHNFCKDAPSRKEWEQRLFEEEGITNVFQRPEVKQKIQQTIYEKYGDEDPRRALTRGSKVYSKIHKQIVELLNIKYPQLKVKIEKKIKGQNRYFFFDIFINPNIIIEVNGDYWHGNPKIYKENDIILKGSSNEYTVKEKWEKDNNKINIAKELGYKILIVWEKDIKENMQQVERNIHNYLIENGALNEINKNKENYKT